MSSMDRTKSMGTPGWDWRNERTGMDYTWWLDEGRFGSTRGRVVEVRRIDSQPITFGSGASSPAPFPWAAFSPFPRYIREVRVAGWPAACVWGAVDCDAEGGSRPSVWSPPLRAPIATGA